MFAGGWCGRNLYGGRSERSVALFLDQGEFHTISDQAADSEIGHAGQAQIGGSPAQGFEQQELRGRTRAFGGAEQQSPRLKKQYSGGGEGHFREIDFDLFCEWVGD
jgi:hypothetical protein